MNIVKITPGMLSGKVVVPASKSIAHRAVIAAGLSNGESRIRNIVMSDDIKATIKAMESLGAQIMVEDKELLVKSSGRLLVRHKHINCCESGSTLRFLIPISLLTENEIFFSGVGRLTERPLDPYIRIFEEQNIKYKSMNGRLPLSVTGPLKPGVFRIKGDISSQFISGLLFALPLLNGNSKIIITSELQSKGYVDLTIDTLKKFSVEIEHLDYSEFNIKGNQNFTPSDYTVEGDYSQAAFWLAAGALGNKIECKNLCFNSLQGDKRIIDIIKKMGGLIDIYDDYATSNHSSLKGITIDASQIPDLVPIITVLGALSCGVTNIINAGRLRIKESDRLHAITAELNKLGADIVEKKDSLIISGKESLIGGDVNSWNDHRIAMSLAIASIKCKEPVFIRNSGCVNKSYPDFFKDFVSLGGNIDEWSMG